MVSVNIGIRTFAVCAMRSTVPYSAGESAAVYRGTRISTRSFEPNDPIAKVTVFIISVL